MSEHESIFDLYEREFEENETRRCCICDFHHLLNNDIQGQKRTFKWDDSESGYVCSECDTAVRETLDGFGYSDDDLESIAFLEE